MKNVGSVSVGYTGYPNIYMGSQTNPLPDENWGKWGLEVWGENFNIWKPWPSPNNGDNNYYLFITPAGAVGIGKAPTYSEICLDVQGKVYAYGFEVTSDERLKSDIKPLTEEVNKLYKLTGKTYVKMPVEEEIVLPDILDEKGNIIKKYEKSVNKQSKGISEFGFIAQELKDIYPELVSQDTLGYYYVNYIGLIPVLVEALKEQKTQLENLSTQLKSLSPVKSLAPTQQGIAPTTNILEKNLPSTLYQNTPNPFSKSTQIRYYLPKEISQALLCIYDMNGKQLRQITLNERGESSITISGSELKAGIYLYGLIADGQQVDVKRMVLTE